MDYILAKTLAKPTGMALDAETPPPTLSLSLDSLPYGAGEEPLDGSVLEGVLSAAECSRIVASAEESGGFGWWDPSGDASAERKRVRNADTVEFEDVGLCEALWVRLAPHMPARVAIGPEQDRCEPDIAGEWVATGLNTHLLINRYASGGHFAPHADGSTVVDFNRRSLYTVLLYLNECAEGGAT